jgi:hypothetical protein
MTEKEMKQELARTLTGYDDCVDCDSCQFANCCYERELANKMWEQGWRKDKLVAYRDSQRAIRVGKILQSRGKQ